MTGKNKKDLLNIYDNKNGDELFSVNDKSKKDTLKEESLKNKKIDTSVSALESIKDDNKKLNIGDNLNNGSIDKTEQLKKEKQSFFKSLLRKKEKNVNNEEKNKLVGNLETSSNIFDDFNQDNGLLDEIDQIKKERDRDMYYYINRFAKVLQIIFILSLVVVSIFYGYIHIQNKIFTGESKDNQLLGPFCFILLDGVNYRGNFCTSIATLNKDYSERLKEIKIKQKTEILNVIKRVYEIENFTKTKYVLFLKDKTENKLKVLDILEKFDDLKNEFTKVDKQIIQCQSIAIDEEDQTISMKCNAYSAGYESGIRGFDGTNNKNSEIKGTSISVANSFLNYISLESKTFTIINRQKLFKLDNIVGGKTGFTNKTAFSLKLKYNLN